MAYLRYYRYRGDPGFFSSLGKLAGKALKIGGGFIPGVGGLVSKVGAFLDRPTGQTYGQAAQSTAIGLIPGGGIINAGVGGIGIIKNLSSGSKTGTGGFGDVVTGHSSTAPMYHRKRPHMQVTNTRALRRAMRRVEGFAKLAKKTISFTHRVRMKTKRRK